MFVKRKKNRSGTTSIVVAEKTKGIYKELITIGVAKDSNDVGSSHPGAVFGPKGLAVRQLKRYASWVQNVVRQFGPYLSWA